MIDLKQVETALFLVVQWMANTHFDIEIDRRSGRISVHFGKRNTEK